MYTESLKYIEHSIVVSVSPGKCLCLRNQHMRRKAAGSRRMHEAGKQKLFVEVLIIFVCCTTITILFRFILNFYLVGINLLVHFVVSNYANRSAFATKFINIPMMLRNI